MILYITVYIIEDVSNPSENIEAVQICDEVGNDEYETMSNGSSTESSNSSDDIVSISGSVDADESTLRHNLIRNYSVRTVDSVNRLICNNEYVRACFTTKDWDEKVMFDSAIDDNIQCKEFVIPDELVEGMCFQTKKNL